MKIVYIAESTVPSQSANSVHVMKMCQALASNEHEVILLIPNKKDKNIALEDVYDFYGVNKCFGIKKIPFIGGKIGFIVFCFLSIIKTKKESPDLFYTRSLFACLLGSLLNLPTIFEIHSSFTTKTDILFFKLINKRKLKKIVVISNALKDHLLKKYNIPENKILVAPDGADPISPNLKVMEINSSNKLKIGYVGHLYKGRGIDVIADMAQRCDWAEFHLVGGLPEDLIFWKKELCNHKNIIFYGHLPHKEIPKYMLGFDVLVAPYQEKVCVYGGGGNTSQWMSPLKIFEYMATGKAILASDMPALREILAHEKNSLLAPPKDIDRWVENLEKIKNDLSLREKLGANAKSEFEKKYTWKSRANFILNNYNV